MREGSSITVRNRQRRSHLDLDSLQSFSERALQLSLGKKGRGPLATSPQVDVLLVSDRRIAAIHQEFMNIPGPTDVITFQHGEIFVSVETAKRNARRFKTTTDREIRLYIVHGLLHLQGYDDKRPRDAQAMEATQSKILQALSAPSAV